MRLVLHSSMSSLPGRGQIMREHRDLADTNGSGRRGKSADPATILWTSTNSSRTYFFRGVSVCLILHNAQ